MTTQNGSNPTLIYTPKALNQLVAHLRRQSLLALDTESDSLYSYYSKVCLIQISVCDGSDAAHPSDIVDYLVDPLRLNDLSPLGALFSTPGLEVVMHAADNDMLMLYRHFGFTFSRIFDTQLAARILGWKHVGLAAILEERFGIVSDKRMQRTNWGKRPLMPQQIAYAQMDTHYLLPLRALLIDELKAKQRWEEAQDAFQHLVDIDFAARPVEERTFWNMKVVKEVPREHHGILEALWHWREDEARHQDRPPFKIMNDSVLAALATRLPANENDMRSIHGLSDHQVRRYGSALLHTLRDGRRRRLPSLPENDSRPEHMLEKTALARFDALRKWRSDKARTRGVTADIVLTNATLLAIAQRNPQTLADLEGIPDMGPWKLRTYGPEILATLEIYQTQHPAG
ncbi:MAG: HRDC domain-containing protein [Caldilineaceae bacterium]|nr:HRDC domain-containing protein [Caldilineaceae bacterium]